MGVAAGPEGAALAKTLETPIHVLKPGTLIAGKYRIVEEVGHGGMGVVYKAEDLKLKRSVALKFLPPHLMDSPELKERFLVEAQAAAALSHPNICTIYEVGESEEHPYIAMEFVDGETLRDRIRKGPFEPGEAVGLVDQVAAGLGEAHQKGIIHRDIKSANIMVTAKGQAKVMDDADGRSSVQGRPGPLDHPFHRPRGPEADPAEETSGAGGASEDHRPCSQEEA